MSLQSFTVPGPFTFIPAVGETLANVRLWAGGAGGMSNAGNGGGAGAGANKLVNLSPSNNGYCGDPGLSDTDGTASWFGSTSDIFAPPGLANGAGGALADCIGDYAWAGGNGGLGSAEAGGGGGASGGTYGNGGNGGDASGPVGGAAGIPMKEGKAGGKGGDKGHPGVDAAPSLAGGGGGGGLGQPGGKGQLGKVTIVPNSVADFTYTPNHATGYVVVTFTDISTNFPSGWHWQKNDGSGWVDFANPTRQNPTEPFTTGTWSVRVVVTNLAGNTAPAATMTKTNIIVVS